MADGRADSVRRGLKLLGQACISITAGVLWWLALALLLVG